MPGEQDATGPSEDAEANVEGAAIERAQIGRYRVLRVLGEGGMGIVYAGYDDELARALAIKLLRGAGAHASPAARGRMRREAQAMAQLSHANVVQIYDVGEDDGEVYLAMELVRGQTLDAWLAEQGPARVREQRWREIVGVFVAAGRGLAAAHAAGLVHRDFKPANVLVGEGVVKVGDFGLARGDGEVELAAAAGEGTEPESSGRKLTERMTETGAVVGTPAYLAPEQLTAREVSAASDQFAFCVALYEALLGERPFPGDDMRTLAASLLMGQRRSVPTGTAVPGWVLAVVDRGLAREPSGRWPSMEALIAALLDDPARRRRRRIVLGGAVLGAVAVGGALGVRELRHRSECEALGAAVDERWSAEAQQQIDEAFANTEALGATETWGRVQPRLDAWAQEWRAARVEACDEGRDDPERGRQRAACLEHERWELEALLDAFTAADRTTVIEAVTAAAELPEVARCSDLTWLASDASLRVATAGSEEDGATLRRDLARVLALERAGRYQESLALAQASVESARALGDPVLEAEALAKLGGIRWRMSDFPGAETDLLAGHLLAGRVEHDPIAYATARDLSWVVGVQLARPREGRVWLELARMNLARSGEDPRAAPEMFERLGEIEVFEGHPAEALAAHEQALVLREQHFGTEHPAIAESLLVIGTLRAALGDERALATLEHARELAMATLGPDHPTVATVESELGGALYSHERFDESITALRRAITIRERALGPDELGLATILSSLGAVLHARGEPLESLLVLERAAGIFERSRGLEHPETLSAKSNLAAARAEFGQVDEALESLRDMLPVAERVLTPNDPRLASIYSVRAYYLARRGLHGEALPSLRRIVEIDQSNLGPNHVQLASSLQDLARSAIAVGEHETALSSMNRVLAIREAALRPDDPVLAQSYDDFALVLLALGRVDAASEAHGRALAIRAKDDQGGDAHDLTGLREELARLHGEAAKASPRDDLSPQSP